MPISTRSNDISLEFLLNDVQRGVIQLPNFQRSWIWDDARIRAIIASISQGYPVGAILCLERGNPNVQFKYRTLEGVDEQNILGEPKFLILDGQQRLTSIYQAIFSQNPVKVRADRKESGKVKVQERYYYLKMEECLRENVDRLDAIISVLAKKTADDEYADKTFPLNIVFDSDKSRVWTAGYGAYYSQDDEARKLFNRFNDEVLKAIVDYRLPVITIPKEAPREAVCKMFENVNTGGVTLTVFELLTAMFAPHDGFNLRNDWEKCRKTISESSNTDLFDDIDATMFLTAVTLYTSYMKKKKSKDGKASISCKKKDVLGLPYEDYIKNSPAVVEGFKRACKFLSDHAGVYRKTDLPYMSQLVPLGAICAALGNKCDDSSVENMLLKWYWCGIFGEMYGGANETRYVNDIEDIMAAANDKEKFYQIGTIDSASFSARRLLSLQSKVSAAYRGVLALLCTKPCHDFVSKITLNKGNVTDIHHIFPEAYFNDNDKINNAQRINSIVNKTPMLPSTNRSIGGIAPKDYLNRIKDEQKLTDDEMRARVESHFIDYDLLSNNDFDKFFVDRAKNLLTLIEEAMGKKITDRDSAETIRDYGESLV